MPDGVLGFGNAVLNSYIQAGKDRPETNRWTCNMVQSDKELWRKIKHEKGWIVERRIREVSDSGWMPGESFSVKAAFEYFETDNLTEGVRRAGLWERSSKQRRQQMPRPWSVMCWHHQRTARRPVGWKRVNKNTVGEAVGDRVMKGLRFVIRTLDFTLRKMRSRWSVYPGFLY